MPTVKWRIEKNDLIIKKRSKTKIPSIIGQNDSFSGTFLFIYFFRLARVVVELSLHNCCSTTVDVFVELVPRFVQFGLLTLNYLNLLCFS